MTSRKQMDADPVAQWSDPGPYHCEFCQHSFHIEVGYYCHDCDRAVCPVCVVTVREQHTLSCPDCHTERSR